MDYKPTIGLEIHVELKTKTKMFCGCLNNPDEKHPNWNICPICLGHPGTLPTANEEAIRKVLLVGLALNCKIAENSFFERKNYFYPDLPKGYQISQYKKPLCEGGYLEIFLQPSSDNTKEIKSKKIRLQRIHIEEDTGRLLHSNYNGRDKLQKEKFSLVDFNRAGVPLMELVTEPDFESAEEVKAFVEELQLILRYLKVSDADMEKGQLRVEVNISLQSLRNNSLINNKEKKLGTKVEIKNLNSLKAAMEAIDYEIKRQSMILERGDEVKQETRGWDEKEQKTVPQRFKEEAHDYRYFPEPDLPPILICKDNSGEAVSEKEENFIYLEEIKANLPELPEAKRQRFEREYNLSRKQAELLVKDKFLADYFESAASELRGFSPDAKVELLYNYLTTDLLGLIKGDNSSFSELKIKPEQLAHLVFLIEKGEIMSRQAKDILREMFETGSDPEEIMKAKGFKLISDKTLLSEAIEKVISRNLKAVSDYKKGKSQALQFLLGETMREIRGRGNPSEIQKIIEEELKNLSI